MSVELQKNINLQSYNTLSIPAKAQAFASVKTVEELRAVLAHANTDYNHLLVIGSGSNIVLPDYFEGLVVQLAIKGSEIEEETGDTVLVSFAAGENWHEAVMWSVDQTWFGLENLALIPGTVGAAPVQNIGAYGVELKDRFVYLEAMHIKTGKVKTFTREDCGFSYRESVFKQSLKDQWVILRVVLQLSKNHQSRLEYPALKNALAHLEPKQLTPRQIAEAVITIRQSKLPAPEDLPNAGSFFKNPIIEIAHFEKLKKQFPTIAHYVVDKTTIKIAAGWLLEQDGWKGKLVNGIGMHKDQALVLINPKGLSAKHIVDFAVYVQESILKKFNIVLEIEPMIIPSTATEQSTSGQNGV